VDFLNLNSIKVLSTFSNFVSASLNHQDIIEKKKQIFLIFAILSMLKNSIIQYKKITRPTSLLGVDNY
jgi:hypothetical protein